LHFRLSTGKIFGFSDFKPKKIRPNKIRSKKDPGLPTFGPEIFGRKKFRTVQPERDGPDRFPEVYYLSVVKPVVMRAFSTFRCDLFTKFRAQKFVQGNLFRYKRFRRDTPVRISPLCHGSMDPALPEICLCAVQTFFWRIDMTAALHLLCNP
jgi:hypothetical protein